MESARSAQPMRPEKSSEREAPSVQVVEITDAMIAAYLEANDAYWKRVDDFGPPPIGIWRDGTPKEATREGLRAALAQASALPAAQQPAVEPPNRAFALLLLSEACKSGHAGTIKLAAQLAGVPACEGCGYVVQHCRCASPTAQPGEKP